MNDSSLSTNYPAKGLSLSTTPLPPIIQAAGVHAEKRFWEFFTATIRNKNTRMAYWTAVLKFFGFCDSHGLNLASIQPIHVAAYIEAHSGAPSTVKQHLAALRMFFDWLVTGQIVPHNPAMSVKGPKLVVTEGKTPILSAIEDRELLDSIDVSHVVGLRDRALIGVMLFSFARVSAVVGMQVKDYYHQGRRSYFCLHEKGGRFNRVPSHHLAQDYVDAYIQLGEFAQDKKGPLFRSSNRSRKKILTNQPFTRIAAIRMIKRRAAEAGLPPEISCHSFRGTGITEYLKNGGTIENAARIAGHSSTRTTQLYDRTKSEISLNEIERIHI